MKYEKLLCPVCNQYIGKNNYSRHLAVCDGSKRKSQQDVYVVDHSGLNCKFCDKLCKNHNSLIQHEIRCGKNPSRKDFNKLTDYVLSNVKGKTKENCASVAKQVDTMKKKYECGYTHPCTGRKIEFEYLYKEHNDFEIQKWINYVNGCKIEIPEYLINKSKLEGYTVISKKSLHNCSIVGTVLEHHFIADLYLNGKLDSDNTVHHIDGIRNNNDIHNLMVFENNTDHKRFHNSKYSWLIYNENTHLFSCILKDNFSQ